MQAISQWTEQTLVKESVQMNRTTRRSHIMMMMMMMMMTVVVVVVVVTAHGHRSLGSQCQPQITPETLSLR